MQGKNRPTPAPGKRPKRAALPANLGRAERHHEPENTTCACGCALKRVGEDVSAKLDYTPGVFTVERHIRGKWACAQCRTLTQAPVPAEIIDKGIPTSGLPAQVLVAKYADHRRCIARRRSSAALVSRCHARRWGPGSACAACNCSPWSTR